MLKENIKLAVYFKLVSVLDICHMLFAYVMHTKYCQAVNHVQMYLVLMYADRL